MTQINTDKKAKVKNEVLFLSVLIRVHRGSKSLTPKRRSTARILRVRATGRLRFVLALVVDVRLEQLFAEYVPRSRNA